jgi:hypothetical protein
MFADILYGFLRPLLRNTRKILRNGEITSMNKGFTVPISISESARIVGIDPDKARYWLKLLGVETTKGGKTRCISQEALHSLTLMVGLVSEGKLPGEAAKVVKENPQDISPVQSLDTSSRLEGIEKALLSLTESFQKENKALREDNQVLKREVLYLRSYLVPQVQLQKVIPWKPETPKDALEGMTWFQRTLVKWFEPWKMRKYSS